MVNLIDNLLNFFSIAIDSVKEGGIIKTLLGLIDTVISIISGTINLVSNDIIGGLIFFIFELLNYIPVVFIILQASILGLSVVNGRGEDGALSPFILIQNFTEYQIYWITGIFHILMFGLDMIHKVINSIKPT